MAALKWLTPRRQSATERSVLAGEAAAEAAESALAAGRAPQDADRDTHGDRADRRAGEPGADEPRFPVPGDPRAAAFFDLDNTVMQGAAIFHFGRGLYKRKFFDKRDLLRFAWQQAYFRLAGAEDPEHMQDARDSALSIVKGRRVEEITHIGEEIYDEYMAGKIWPGTRALAQAHLDAGQRVWLVTAAPVETATIIARRLGLTGALGTVAESVGGVYTGRLVGEPLHGPAKAEAVRALATAEDLDLSVLRRLQRLRQRHPDALAGRPPVRHQPRRRAAPARPRRRAGGCATTAPGARPRRSVFRRPRGWAPSPAACLPRSPLGAGPTERSSRGARPQDPLPTRGPPARGCAPFQGRGVPLRPAAPVFRGRGCPSRTRVITPSRRWGALSGPRGPGALAWGGALFFRGAGNCATSHDVAARRHRPGGAVAVASGPPAGGRLPAQFPAPLKTRHPRAGGGPSGPRKAPPGTRAQHALRTTNSRAEVVNSARAFDNCSITNPHQEAPETAI